MSSLLVLLVVVVLVLKIFFWCVVVKKFSSAPSHWRYFLRAWSVSVQLQTFLTRRRRQIAFGIVISSPVSFYYLALLRGLQRLVRLNLWSFFIQQNLLILVGLSLTPSQVFVEIIFSVVFCFIALLVRQRVLLFCPGFLFLGWYLTLFHLGGLALVLHFWRITIGVFLGYLFLLIFYIGVSFWFLPFLVLVLLLLQLILVVDYRATSCRIESRFTFSDLASLFDDAFGSIFCSI